MAVTLVSGIRGTGGTQGILADRRIIEMHKDILLLEPSATPLTVLIRHLDSKSVSNPEFKVLTDELLPRTDAINNGAGYTSGNTSLVVDDGTKFAVGNLVKVSRTGEVLRVTAVSTNTLTVTRSWGGTAAAAINDDDVLVILGTAHAEGASSGTPVTTKTVVSSNYTQIWRTPFGVTGTTDASSLYGGDDMDYQAKKKGIEHMLDIERSLWFGEKNEDVSGALPLRSTGGVDEWITTNVTGFGGGFTDAAYENALRDAFRYGDKAKLQVSAPRVLSKINVMNMGKIELVPESKTFGLALTRHQSPHGMITHVSHDLFEGADYAGYAYVLDLSQLGYRYMDGRDTQLRTNVQNPGDDIRKDEYLTEGGLFRGEQRTCAKFTAIAAP